MSRSVDQMFVKHKDPQDVASSLEDYVSTIGKAFYRHPRYQLNGVEEVLRILIKRKREFAIYSKSDWTVVWELVEQSTFADPDIVRHLASKLSTTAIWINYDENFNIWAYQEMAGETLVGEQFLPESYFLGAHELNDRFNYGSCMDVSEAFNSKHDLPEFLTGIGSIKSRVSSSKKFLRASYSIRKHRNQK